MSKIKKVKIGTDEYDIGVNYTNVDNAPSIPTKVSELQNDSGFISQEVEPQFNASASKNITSQDISNWNAKADISDIPDVSDFITKDVNDLTNYELKADTGHSIAMSIDSSTYVLTLSLKNSAGTILNTQTVDLPLESVVVDGEYDSTNKKIVLELQNGNTIDVPVGDLINGLQSEITSSNKLDASLVDDSLSTNKFVTSAEKTAWNGKEDTSNKVSTIDANSTNTQYAGAKAVWDLVSGLGGTTINELTMTGSYLRIQDLEPGFYTFQYPYGLNNHYVYKNRQGGGFRLPSILLMKIEQKINFDDRPTATKKIGIIIGIGDETYSNQNATKFNIYTLNQNTSGELVMVAGNGNTTYMPLTVNAQYIWGEKTFVDIPKIKTYTAPTQDTQLTPKKYIDDSITAQIGNINTILATLTTPSNGGGE